MSSYADCTTVTPECPVEATTYGYYPSLAANGFFLAFFVLFAVLNLGVGTWYKTWTFTVAMFLACVTEAIGYVGRIMLHNNPWSNTGFIIQICCLIIGPAFNSGAIYLTLKYITLTFGSESSRIPPWLYTWIFIGGDLISLVLQAIGGAMASSADNDPSKLKTGDNIAMGGICWQVFTLFAFAVTTADYVIRRRRSSVPLTLHASSTFQSWKFQVFAGATILAWLTIFVRCVYRIIEFAQGWGNDIMSNQTYFIVLEGVMIVIATFCQTVPHPGYFFPALSFGTRGQLPQTPIKRVEDPLFSQETLAEPNNGMIRNEK